jgi:hypothetical protein
MRIHLLPLVVLVVLELCALKIAGQSCTDVTVNSVVRNRKLVRGKAFHLAVTIDVRPKTSNYGNGLVLQVTLPQGIYFTKPSKSLPTEPSFWGYHDSNLVWPLDGTRRRKLRVNLAVACTEENASVRELLFGVSITRMDGQGNFLRFPWPGKVCPPQARK